MFVARHRCAGACPGKPTSSRQVRVAPCALPPRVAHREVRGTYHVTERAATQTETASRSGLGAARGGGVGEKRELVFETIATTGAAMPAATPARAAMPKCYGPYLTLAAVSMVTGWWSMSRVMDNMEKKKALRSLEREEAKRRAQQRYKNILTNDQK
mmetsp:Transcript_34998/g.75795  ORF Transcript_34998/g.75795 Transcript_34998/m.75795 type:complete len:157 (-) Transcript_34998:77-547(-)